MSVELYRKHRPQTFGDVIGQDAAIKSLVELGRSGMIPHTILFSGPSGTGKTTLARILRLKLKCGDLDYVEKNCAEERGIDMVRDINTRRGAAAISGKCRVFLLDEVHQLTADAQSALLKILEDTPNHVYYFLCTTDPQKLKDTIITRCTHIKCKLLGDSDIKNLIDQVLSKEDKVVDSQVVAKVVDLSDGSARKALVYLHQILNLDSVESQLGALESTDLQGEAIEIARALINSKTDWPAMSAILQKENIQKKAKEDPEGIRRMILGYCKAVLLKSGNPRVASVMEEFRDHWYDIRDNGLVLSCYHAVSSR